MQLEKAVYKRLIKQYRIERLEEEQKKLRQQLTKSNLVFKKGRFKIG